MVLVTTMANRRPARRGGTRRRRQWIGIFLDDEQAVAANTQQALIPGTAAFTGLAAEGSKTVVRLRGNYYARASGGTAGDDVLLGLGVILVPDQLTTSTEFPMPLTEPDAPWIWHDYVSFKFKSAADEDTPDITFYRGVIDSKAMRRVTPNQDIAICLETLNGAGTGAVAVQFGFRVLLLA